MKKKKNIREEIKFVLMILTLLFVVYVLVFSNSRMVFFNEYFLFAIMAVWYFIDKIIDGWK